VGEHGVTAAPIEAAGEAGWVRGSSAVAVGLCAGGKPAQSLAVCCAACCVPARACVCVSVLHSH